MYVFVSEEAWPELTELIYDSAGISGTNADNCTIITVHGTDAVYDAVAAHADIYMCPVGGRIFTAPQVRLGAVSGPGVQPDQAESGAAGCVPAGFAPALRFSSPIGSRYPENVKYNACICGRFFIHNLRYTDPELLKYAVSQGLVPVNVRQGYSKCNIVSVGGTGIITSDRGIADVVGRETDLDVMVVETGHVALRGFNYGFLGGASGEIGNKILFNGDLSGHPDFRAICRFIRDQGREPVWLPGKELTDVGSILCGIRGMGD